MQRKQLVGALCCFGLCLAILLPDICLAQDPDAKKKALIKKMNLQAKCLLACYDRGYQRYYRCGLKRFSVCQLKVDIASQACIAKCSASWFCPNMRKTYAQCPAMCLKSYRKKWLQKHVWNKSKKQKRRPSLMRRFRRWQKRSRSACLKLCKAFGRSCALHGKLKLPAATPIDKSLLK